MKLFLMGQLFLVLILSSCSTTEEEFIYEKEEVGSIAHISDTQDHMLLAVNWYQKAAETKALSYQAFNAARAKVKMDLANKSLKGKRAVVLDIDETILDNSPYQARNILQNKSYPNGWAEWIDMAAAKLIPGAKGFIKFAHRNGVEIFYVSNRKIRGLDATIKNLKAHGLPVKKENVLLRTTTSSKKARRASVLKNHRVVLYVGDALTDFSELFDKQPTDQRSFYTDKFWKEFGSKFIVLPNPMYGDWEGAIFQYNWGKSPLEKDQDRRRALRAY